MLDMTFRTAAHRDLPAMAALLQQMDLGDDAPLSLEDLERAFLSIQNTRDYDIYVAVIDGEPRAMFTLLSVQDLSHNMPRVAIISNVVVDADLRGQGVGHAMIKFALDVARSAGCDKMMLTSNLKREAAHRFYLDLGFKQHGLSFYYDLD